MTPEEIQRLEEFATDLIRIHSKLEQAINDANREGIETTQKVLSLYVDVKSFIRKNTKIQEGD